MKLRWLKERECNRKWYKQFNTCLMDYFSHILLIVYFIIFSNEVLNIQILVNLVKNT
jgi:hypothetical protein